jgi:hypothetical protein
MARGDEASFGNSEEGPREADPAAVIQRAQRTHRREAGKAGPMRDPHQHRLRLIIEGVRGEDEARADIARSAGE